MENPGIRFGNPYTVKEWKKEALGQVGEGTINPEGGTRLGNSVENKAFPQCSL
jgi:hypothetical protein